MKNKFYLIFAMILMLCCLFVISANAEVTTYDDAPARTKYTVSVDDVVVFNDGFTCPSAYVFKDQQTIPAGGHNRPATFPSCVDFEYINSKTEKNYTVEDIVEFDIPQGITFVGFYAFLGNTHIKKVTFPNSVTSLGNAIFQNATGLEECTLEFSKDNPNRVFPSYMFFGCKNLKAFSMPDCFTSLYDVGHFSGCTNLSAVHLSESLETWSSGGGGSRTATFDDCVNMYFVNETFTYDNIPEKPEVYYFPANLKSISNNSVCRECKNLNDVLVFGTQITTMPNIYFFQNGPANKIVFLGDMTTVATQYWGKTTEVYFANKNDIDLNSVTFSGGKTAVFCYAEGNTNHLAEKTVTEEAKCELDAGKYTYCFCGQVITKEAIEGTALSHDYDYVNGNGTLISLNYADLSFDGTKTVKCGLCEKEDNTIFAKKLFDYIGYSTNDKGDMCVTYDINLTEIKEYEAMYGKLNYGFVASANNDTPLDENGNEKTNAVKIDLGENEYTKVDFLLRTDNWQDEKVASVKFTLNMYVIVDNAVKYVTYNGCKDTAEAYTYSEI